MSRPAASQQVTTLSKLLSWILRHHAVELGLHVRPDGYVSLNELMQLPQIVNFKPRPTFDDIRNVVDSNDKKRFGLTQEGEQWLIRAHQGHSGEQKEVIQDDVMLEQITDPRKYPVCVHGTTKQAWNMIQKSGLNRMARKHIHFSSKDFGAADVVSGMRSSSQILVYIDLDKAMKAGIKFYVSQNEVILSEGNNGVISPEFFSKVELVQGSKRAKLDLKKIPAANPAAPTEHKAVPCRFDYLLILDFEATCEENVKLNPMEIIEFPIIILNTSTLEEVARFHHYVRPTVHPHLTPFCTSLTGITQATVDEASPFPVVWGLVLEFLKQHELIDAGGHALQRPHKWAFVTCGDWDFKTMLPSQLLTSHIAEPSFASRWINIKDIFGSTLDKGRKGGGMAQMLSKLRLPLKGRHHSGIDDCANIAEIAKALLRLGADFELTFSRR